MSRERELIVAAPAPISLYATRWKPLLGALGCAGFIAVDLLVYLVLPTPDVTANPWMYQEPFKTLLFIAGLLIFAYAGALGVYWTLTPVPLLRLSASELVYRPFPRPTFVMRWDEVEGVLARVSRRAVGPAHLTFLTLRFTVKPHHRFAGSAQQPLRVEINLGQLSLRADDLVRLLRTFHEVEWLETGAGDIGRVR